MADPWKMEGEDDGDWEVLEEIVDYWDDGDGDDTAKAAAAFEKELAEFEGNLSSANHYVSVSDNTQDQDETDTTFCYHCRSLQMVPHDFPHLVPQLRVLN